MDVHQAKTRANHELMAAMKASQENMEMLMDGRDLSRRLR
jgi:hypothetical protein